jgi:hypothetical protein
MMIVPHPGMFVSLSFLVGNIPHQDMFLQTYYQYLAIENTIYVHTIFVSYTVCVSWIKKSSDVRFTNLKL